MRNHIPLSFPATRKALWSHMAIGGSVTLVHPRVNISVSEQVLFLAHGHSRSGKAEHCHLCGDFKVEADCSEVSLVITQFDSGESSSASPIQGYVRIPTKLMRKARCDTPELQTAELEAACTSVTNRAKSAAKVDVSEFSAAVAECTIFSGSNQISCDVDICMLTLQSKFNLTPLEPVNIAMTALSKSILGPNKHGIVSSHYKSGFVTMDQYRKAVFLLESDPKVQTVPIVGIWVSGVDLITDPFVWAVCVKYMHATHISDRVSKPSEPFLLIHKSELMSSPQFFDCVASSAALSMKLLTGTQSFSMEKEVAGKRKGVCSVRMEPLDMTLPRGREFTHIVEQALIKEEKENRIATRQTPKTGKHIESVENLEDSLPWGSPHMHKHISMAIAPAVPDVSLLEESSPKLAPRPERPALQQLTDNRLNRSPLVKEKALSSAYHHDQAARKISFDHCENNPTVTPRKLLSSLLAKTPQSPGPASLSRPTNHNSGRTNNSRKGPRSLSHTLSHSTMGKSPVAKLIPFPQSPPEVQSRTQADQPAAHQMNHRAYPQAPSAIQEEFNMFYPQPCAAVNPHQQNSLHPCQCQAANHYNTPQLTQHTPTYSRQHQNIRTPVQNQLPPQDMSPEVQAILHQQDQQLKALQAQIQKLLNSQETRPAASHEIETQTSPFRCTASVNTGVSLYQVAKDELSDIISNSAISPDHDSSQSHSLTQHDLTHLDITTQVTARSFTSDINVDYESFDDSIPNSPKAGCGSSETTEESWQSPVLGESVSMIAQGMDQESTRHQLDVIIKNVQGLLAKHTPMPPEQTVKEPESHSSKITLANEHTSPISSASAAAVASTQTTEKKHIGPDEVAEITRNQLRRFGVDVRTSNQSMEKVEAAIPRLQYISMRLSDSVLSESDRSLELNALALKYLKDEQLTELAQFTVQSKATDGKGHSSLLRQILTMSASPTSTTVSANTEKGMSFATHQYMKRYGLVETSMEEDTGNTIDVAPQVFENIPAKNLKSILKPAVEKPRDSDEMSIQVLDIARLKELPKLL